MNSLPKTVTQQRRVCDLNPGPYASESSTLTTWLPSHPCMIKNIQTTNSLSNIIGMHETRNHTADQ